MKKIIPLIIGFFILSVLIFYVGIENIIDVILKINVLFFAIAAGIFLIIEFFATLKLKLISKLSFSKIFLSHLGGMFLSQITPGKTGYLYTAYSIAKKEKKSISRTIGSVAYIQGIMMLTKIFVITLALIYFLYYFKIPWFFFISLITIFTILIMIFVLLYSKKLTKILFRIPFLKKFELYLSLIQDSVKEITIKKTITMIFLDIMGWFFYGLQFYFLFTALNLNISFITCLMLHPIISAITFIPISPSALGIAESINEVLFKLIGLSAGVGISFLLIFRLNIIIIDSIGLIDLKTIKVGDIFKKLKKERNSNIKIKQ